MVGSHRSEGNWKPQCYWIPREGRKWRQDKWGQGEFKGTILEYQNPAKQKEAVCVEEAGVGESIAVSYL